MHHPKSRHRRKPPVAGHEGGAPRGESGRQLDGVRRLHARLRAELGGEAEERSVAATGEQDLVSAGKCRVARAIGDDERLEKRQRRGDGVQSTSRDRFEELFDGAKMPRVLLDQVDEDRSVECNGTGAECGAQRHERRSRAT